MTKLVNIAKSLLVVAILMFVFASCEKEIIQAPNSIQDGDDGITMELRDGEEDPDERPDDGGVHDGDDDEDFDSEDHSETDDRLGGDDEDDGRGN